MNNTKRTTLLPTQAYTSAALPETSGFPIIVVSMYIFRPF